MAFMRSAASASSTRASGNTSSRRFAQRRHVQLDVQEPRTTLNPFVESSILSAPTRDIRTISGNYGSGPWSLLVIGGHRT